PPSSVRTGRRPWGATISPDTSGWPQVLCWEPCFTTWEDMPSFCLPQVPLPALSGLPGGSSGSPRKSSKGRGDCREGQEKLRLSTDPSILMHPVSRQSMDHRKPEAAFTSRRKKKNHPKVVEAVDKEGSTAFFVEFGIKQFRRKV